MRRPDPLAWAAAGLAAVLGSTVGAHQPITSKYTYNEHVFPVVEARCGRCHFPGGPTPMSLLSYAEAAPWAESIREQLTQGAMPPIFTDPSGPEVRHADVLSGYELDVLLTWASGGAPQGDITKALPPASAPVEWRQGPPDLVVPLPEQVLAAGEVAGAREVTVDSGLDVDRWVRLVDVRPGTVSMVRMVTVATDSGQVLTAWVPGDPAVAAPSGAAFRLAARTRLHVRLQYRKHWKDEQERRSDASSLGIYFTSAPVTGKSLASLDFSDPKPLEGPVRVLAVRPTIDRLYEWVQVDAVTPGHRVPLLRLEGPRPGWNRRYWLAEPTELPAGARLEVTAVPAGEAASSPAPPGVSLDVLPL